jgi:hypothetical protein
MAFPETTKRLPRMFSVDSAKAIKAQGYGYLNGIHYMAPYRLAGVGNMCPKATPACVALCLGWTSGQAGMVKDVASDRAQGNSVRASRIAKTQFFMWDRSGYMAELAKQAEKIVRDAARQGLQPCLRLNGSSDIAWEGLKLFYKGKLYANIFEAFPDVQFVDYTKVASRLYRDLPTNYHLTLSRTEENDAECIEALKAGHNVAVVFAKALPAMWNNFPVIDGDKHDLRHLDKEAAGFASSGNGVVVGLLPKGRMAKKDATGFVVREAA